MKEYIIPNEVDVTIGDKIVKFVGAVTIFKYKGYYKIGVAGIDEVFYFRVKTAKEVTIWLDSDMQLKVEDTSEKIQKISENIDPRDDLYNDIKNMSVEDRPEKEYESAEDEEMGEIEIKLEKETKFPFLKINGTELKDVKFKMNNQGQIELDSAIIPTELCFSIYNIVKSIKENVENLKN